MKDNKKFTKGATIAKSCRRATLIGCLKLGSTRMQVNQAELDLLRRSSDLTVDREGFVRHEGELIAHPRLAALLQAGIDVDELGRPIIAFGQQIALLQQTQTPLVVWQSHTTQDSLALQLNNGKRVRIQAADLLLRLHNDRELTVQIDAQRQARFGRAAWANIAERIGGAAPVFWLPVGEHKVSIIVT